MFDCIIFDVDGTLIDTEFMVKKALQKLLLEEINREPSWSELDFILGIPGEITLEKFGISDTYRASRKWNANMIEYKQSVKVYAHIEETLKLLKTSKAGTGLVTSKNQIELNDDFVPFGLMPYFDHYVSASDTARHKPFPDPLLKFLEISGYTAQQVIYIGDTIYDQQAAQAAGIAFGLALWGTKTPDTIQADFKLKTPLDVLSLIN
ncbi:MAG TPA: HAD-IA family hydrolase [Prolixibacteraceae bacterium]|nr:HAD-IA family hydrolase [Prolixibacteraceae bacterium]